MSRPAGLSRPLSLVLGATLALYAAVAAWLVWRTSVLEPYSDMIDWADRWLRLQSDHDYVRYCWIPHNFHHLVWTLGILDLDIRAFGGQGYLFLAVGAACLGAVAAMLTRLGAQAAGPGLRLLGGGVALAICLMGCQVQDANTVINTTYLHALAFAVAAILLAGGSGFARGAAALVCACAAGLGSAAGLAVWPALAYGAIRNRKWRWLLVLIVVGAAFSALYMVGEGGTGGLPALRRGPPMPLKSVELFIDYLGLPWMRGVPRFGGLIGLILLGASLGALLLRGGRAASKGEQTAVVLIVFSLGTAAMAGLVRTGDMAPELVPMRYAVFLIPMQVGLWVLALPAVRRVWGARPRAAEAAVSGLCLILLAHQAVMALYAVRTGDMNLRVVAAYRQGARDPAVMAVIYPVPAKALAIREALKRRGLYQSELRPDPPPGPLPALSGSGTSVSSTGP
ncbi:MAG: hypothetical protein JSS35_11340 [Proteobacteria bacterium]|nr:hypothetical protein [Pseudomonadota bacterium]